ncbi:hypothetical protein GQR58_007504 [Nymphon striatum]|nr:hypothetical protein GQR58_007504 [Nymphon striatum]
MEIMSVFVCLSVSLTNLKFMVEILGDFAFAGDSPEMLESPRIVEDLLVQELLSRDMPDPTPSLDVLNTITIKQEMQDPPIGNESLGDLTRCCTCGCFQTIPDMPDPTPSLDFMDTIMIKQEMQDPPIGNESPGDLTRCYTCRCSKTIPDKQDPTPSPDIMDTILIKQEKQDPAPSPDVMDAIIIKQEMQDPPIGNESPGDLPPGYSYRWSDASTDVETTKSIIKDHTYATTATKRKQRLSKPPPKLAKLAITLSYPNQ